jgi:hypothetical protein
MKRKVIGSIAALVLASVSLVGCVDSTRQIDAEATDSWPIEGTSWRGFCQGANAFIYVPSKYDSDPDELEAVIYDDFRCLARIQAGKASANPAPSSTSKPDTDPDGLIDDED